MDTRKMRFYAESLEDLMTMRIPQGSTLGKVNANAVYAEMRWIETPCAMAEVFAPELGLAHNDYVRKSYDFQMVPAVCSFCGSNACIRNDENWCLARYAMSLYPHAYDCEWSVGYDFMPWTERKGRVETHLEDNGMFLYTDVCFVVDIDLGLYKWSDAAGFTVEDFIVKYPTWYLYKTPNGYHAVDSQPAVFTQEGIRSYYELTCKMHGDRHYACLVGVNGYTSLRLTPKKGAEFVAERIYTPAQADSQVKEALAVYEQCIAEQSDVPQVFMY